MKGKFEFVMWEWSGEFPAKVLANILAEINLPCRCKEVDYAVNCIVIYTPELESINIEQWEVIVRAVREDDFNSKFNPSTDVNYKPYEATVDELEAYITIRKIQLEEEEKEWKAEEQKVDEERERSLYEKLKKKFEP